MSKSVFFSNDIDQDRLEIEHIQVVPKLLCPICVAAMEEP